jgi:hypothetical protein
MSVWDVTITAAGLGGAAPADGFIDPKSTGQYIDQDATAPTTVANATAKGRANRRYREIVNAVAYWVNAGVTGFVVTGGDANSAPTSIKITFSANQTLQTPDENNAGVTLTGAAAIKRAVARALMASDVARKFEIYNPTSTGVNRQIDGAAPAGAQIKAVGPQLIIAQVGALAANLTAAEAAITVAQVS